MNSFNPIGGYFELELRDGDFPHADSVLLNSGRSCLEYILANHQVVHVYLPKYICDALIEPLTKLGIQYSLYEINDQLEMNAEIDLKDGEFLLYNNYFGLKDDYCHQLASKYNDRFILDCSQAFYFASLEGGHTFYSPRKFFGVPDGGCLATDKLATETLPIDVSYERFSSLIKRIDCGAEAAYEDHKRAEENLHNQPLRQMSKLTRRLLQTIDFEAAREKRLSNFRFLHKHLGGNNALKIATASPACPMVYPYVTDNTKLRQLLIDNKIFVATYWPNVLDWCDADDFAYQLTQKLLPLPIDQRYGREDMQRIVDIIL